MANPRTDFAHGLVVRQQYLSMLFCKIPGEAAWTLMNQARVASPDLTADKKEYRRVGDKNKKIVYGEITADVKLNVYVEDNIAEVARLLGTVRPGGGWVGNEIIQLDPTKVCDLKLVSYDGVTVGSPELFTEYINQFAPGKLGIPEDAEGDVRIAELSGSAYEYYIIPAAGV
jgi:hypothetical protein